MKHVFIFSICFVFIAFLGCGFFSGYGTKLKFGAGELYYKDGITQEKAEALGNYLLKEGFFDEKDARSAQITKKGDAYLFKMVAKPDKLNDETTERLMRYAAMDISADVFENVPVDVELTNESFETQKGIKSYGEKIKIQGASIYRSYETDAATCGRVTDYLASIGFISAQPMTICYGIEGDDFVYELVTKEKAEADPELVEANKTIAGLISVKALNNKPIHMNFLNDDFSIKSTYSYEEIRASYIQFMHDSLVLE